MEQINQHHYEKNSPISEQTDNNKISSWILVCLVLALINVLLAFI